MIIGRTNAQDILQVMVHLILVRKVFNTLKPYSEMKLILSHIKLNMLENLVNRTVLSQCLLIQQEQN